MNYKIKYLTLGIFASYFISCSNDDAKHPNENREIKLSAQVGEKLTRTSSEENIFQGSTVWVWADETDILNNEVLTEGYINAWNLTSTGAGLLMSLDKVKYYYPENSLLNFYGFTGNLTQDAITASETKFADLGSFTHTINNEQTTDEAIAESDLLFGQALRIQPETPIASLTFYHLLTRIQVALMNNYNFPLDQVSIELLNIPKSVTFTPKKLTDISDVEQRKTLFTVGEDKGPIKLKTVVDTPDYYNYPPEYEYASVIIPPTTVDGEFIKVTAGERTATYSLTGNLESGKSYQIMLNIESNGYFTINSITVNDWGANTNMPMELEYQ